jgi:hypothetical protein
MLDEHRMLDCCKLREDLQKATAAHKGRRYEQEDSAVVFSSRYNDFCVEPISR